MTIQIDFTLTKTGNEQIIVKDNNSGWDTLPPAKLVITIRDKIVTDEFDIEERIKTIVLYDPNSSEPDSIGTTVADQQTGTLFTSYTGDGLELTAQQLYNSEHFPDSLYQVQVEGEGDVVNNQLNFYSVDETETLGMLQPSIVERPYTNMRDSIIAITPWQLADTMRIAAKYDDPNLFYDKLRYIKRNFS